MSACLLSQRDWPAAVTLSWEANVRSLRGTHVALAHKQVLGGSLGSCAAQVMAPAELLLLVTWAPRGGRTEHRADRGWAMAGAPHTEAAESGRPEDPTSLENLPREPLPKQNTTWVDVRSKGKGKAEALGPRHSRMRCREAGCAMGTGKELPTGRGGQVWEAHCLTGTNPARPYLWGAAACAPSSRTSQRDECQGNWH